MKKIIFSLFLSMMTVAMMAQGMTDSQVAQFIQREMKAGATQSQIVTKLMQRGVKIDQIRRVRNQSEKQQQSRTSANYDETSPESRLRKKEGLCDMNAPFEIIMSMSSSSSHTQCAATTGDLNAPSFSK